MRRITGVVAALLLLATAMPATAAPASGPSRLTKHDRELLSNAQAQGQRTVTLLVATAPGSSKSVAVGIARLGGTVRYRDDDVSYIRANIPVGQAEAVAKLSGVLAANIDEVIPLEDPRPEATGDNVAVSPPGAGTPTINPYMPTGDIGSPQFVAANPTYDGRGVVIGILDTGLDLVHPALQTAKLLDGTPTYKIKDWVTGTDPFDEDDPTWINMKDQVTVQGGAFTYNGVTYTAPADGQYRVGIFREADPRLCGEYGINNPCTGGDINRDGRLDGLFAVLWNTTSNSVWVDTNQNHDFTDDLAMTDFRVNRDMGYFGTDNPATAVSEAVPFVVQTDGKNKVVNIGITAGAHSTHVAGIAAGKGLFGGAMNGGAPEAQIVSVRACMFAAGCTAHALVEGMIWLAKQANVDVINMSIGGLPALNDGNNTRAIVYNRLIDQYKVQMFISAGNSGPGINTVGDPSVATKVMSVGSYVTKETWYSNYGAIASQNEALHVYSSRGPREDGGFKPNMVAPGAAVSSVPTWQGGQPVGGTYALPPGYGMFNGTSMAAPQATGGAALLISAAKQAGVQYKPEQLRQAFNSSARFVTGVAAHEQGNGLFQVGAAWEMLQKNLKTAEITSAAPVNTVLSGYLATPGYGPGIYEREGWAPGDSGTRKITFTRKSGSAQPVTYQLQWVGNEAGPFSSAAAITLPLNKPVELTVNIGPVPAGVSSAVLNLVDAAGNGVAYQVMNTVVAAYQFTAENNFSVSASGSAARPDKATFFFHVPANTPAFKVDVAATAGRVRVLRNHPYGTNYDSTTTTTYCNAPCTTSRAASNPMAGVWEVTVDTSRTSAADPSAFTITASALGVDVSPASWTVDPATVGTAYTQDFSFTNRFGTFTGGAVGTALGSAFMARPSIAASGAQQVYDIMVPAGSTSISARIGKPSDNAADLDLFLYDCTGASCVLKSSSTSGSSDEFVSKADPAPGHWKVIVDPYAVPSGSTAYDYLDLFANPMFGSVSVTDPAGEHTNNATWTAAASVTANAAPTAGRFLQGFVQVKNGSTVLGSAEVQLKSVNP